MPRYSLDHLPASNLELSPIQSNSVTMMYKQGNFQKALEYIKFSFNTDIHTSHPDLMKSATLERQPSHLTTTLRHLIISQVIINHRLTVIIIWHRTIKLSSNGEP